MFNTEQLWIIINQTSQNWTQILWGPFMDLGRPSYYLNSIMMFTSVQFSYYWLTQQKRVNNTEISDISRLELINSSWFLISVNSWVIAIHRVWYLKKHPPGWRPTESHLTQWYCVRDFIPSSCLQFLHTIIESVHSTKWSIIS